MIFTHFHILKLYIVRYKAYVLNHTNIVSRVLIQVEILEFSYYFKFIIMFVSMNSSYFLAIINI